MTQAFVMEASDLQALVQRLETWGKHVRLEASCRDSLTRQFVNLTELLDYENAPMREIQIFRIHAYSDDMQQSFSLRLDGDTRSNIYFTVEGEESVVGHTNEFVEERLSAMKPWYSLLARADFTFLLLLVVTAVWVGAVVALAFFGSSNPAPATPRTVGQAWLIAGCFFLVPLFIGYILNRFRAATFPMGVFAINQGLKRHREKEFWRSSVIVAFAVSLGASIVAALLFIKT